MFTILSSSHGEQRNKSQPFSLHMFLITIQILFFSSSFLLLAEANNNKQASSPFHFSKFSRQPSREALIFSACKHTPHQATCESTFLSNANDLPQTLEGLFDQSVHSTIAKAQWVRAHAYNLTISHLHKAHNTHLLVGMDDCLELVDDTIDLLANVINYHSKTSSYGYHDDVHTWLSAALTNQETCLESLDEKDKFKAEKEVMDKMAQNLRQFISNSLALFILSSKENLPRYPRPEPTPKTVEATNTNPNGVGGGRKLLSGYFPTWVSAAERKLLEAPVEEIEAHAVVAQDGSGTHKSIVEALGGLQASLESGGRTVIHIKAGTYHEYINIPTKQKNVMLIGDGMGKTTIVGDRSSDDGWTTYKTATVAGMGDGFIARDITIVNSAGPSKHQAVALRVGADKSVIYRCSIVGYQDTLYTHSKRQFYRENDIYGTVDFIFGNSAAVFQSCNIYPRRPASGGPKNFVTAQGRSSPDQNTGISIHNCKITAASDLAPVKSKYETYLGRPWKQYSRTVVMESFLDDSINRAGWSPWAGGFGLKTLYYGEYMNSGPGASTSGRVQWAGYHGSLTSSEAQAFTVGGFISGNIWLPSTGVSFNSGLMG